MEAEMQRVDVVIPTYNRQRRLESTLRALERQTYRRFEVFVVDDASTPAVTPAREVAGLGITVLRQARNRGPGAARNAGVAAGTSPLLAFVDDDVDPDPHWLAYHVAAHGRGDALVTIGPLLAPSDWSPTPWNWWEAETLAREYGRMRAGVYEPTCRQLFTGNAMVRRSDFERAGGFDESLARAEDVELGLRLDDIGCRFAFVPEARGWHYASRTFESWRRMARQYAAADLYIDRQHPSRGWMRMIDHELLDRRVPIRVARAIGRLGGRGRLMSRLAAATAGSAFESGQRQTATRLLSLLYDIEYREELRRLRQESAA
jgi:GT2 family glycosyltransferase